MKKRRPSSSSSTATSLAQVFTNHEASKAFKSKHLNSILNGKDNRKLRVVFINQTSCPLILCWVDGNGGLHHYYKLKPCSKIISGMGRDEIKMSYKETHLENTCIGHSFVLGTCCDDYDEDDDDGITRTRSGSRKNSIGDIVAGYRPTSHTAVDPSGADSGSNELSVHFVTISLSQSSTRWCRPNLRRRRRRNTNTYHLEVSTCEIDSTPLDTSKKFYEDMIIGNWKCKCEEGLFSTGRDKHNDSTSRLTKQIKQRLETDLIAATKKLPPKARKILMENTPIWINKCQKYGPASAPVNGRGMCFHPQSEWLVENGMSPDKCGGVELYEAHRYLDDADLWYGKGGVMLHELSHAYHCKVIEDGYDNEEIRKCYEEAMREKLYHSVEVHNKKGGKDTNCRAYACTDPMEYFAELSTAFLGGVGDDEDLEFNKWYPFNRKQIKEHDPRAFAMLEKMWYGDTAVDNDMKN